MSDRISLRAVGRAAAAALLALVVLAAGRSDAAAEAERILLFDSRIAVHPDGSMTVTETIRVHAEGREIKRGIYRAFPTTYENRFGESVVVDFEVLEVTRDGAPEPFHTRAASNGERVYIGDENVFLRSGPYTYAITYRTDRQIGFFQDFDELYWNVTGNGWAFPIERARATIVLPDGAEVLGQAAYTGPFGAQGTDYVRGQDDQGNTTFETTRTLAPREGLTVAVAWPKGFVAAPTVADRAEHFMRDSAPLLAGLLGLILLGGYYFIVWSRVGKDPAEGTVIPLYEPPEGYPPAAVRFVTRMGFDNKAFAAAIVSMAVKGYLEIEELADEYTLRRTGRAEDALGRGERKMAAKLFGSRDSIVLKQSNHKIIGKARTALRHSLRTDFEAEHFKRNRGYLVPGVILTGLILLAIVLSARDTAAALGIGVWLVGWTAGCTVLVMATVVKLRSHTLKALPMLLFTLPFLGFEAFGLFMFAEATSPLATAVLLAVVATNALFYYLMHAPTLFGRRVMDAIDGFKMYLTVAEKDRLNLMNPPERTPELFEKFLPYALALGVENEWADQFAGVLDAAGAAGAESQLRYRPSWYHGRYGSLGDISSTLGSGFSGAVSSAAAAPGSSSGSGGGGSSGGGGGGGGGGGW